MSKDVVCGGKSKSGVCVCTYLQGTPPGRRCPSGSGAPAQTSHSPGYPRSPAIQNKKGGTKKTIQLQLIPVKSSVFKQNLPTSNNTHGAKPAER